MKLGYFTMPLHPPGRNYLETLKEDRQAILLADRLGFAEAFVGEHTTDLAETIPSCLMFLSSLVHDTKNITQDGIVSARSVVCSPTKASVNPSRSASRIASRSSFSVSR